MRFSDLAEALHTDLSSVSRQVQSAERRGLVEQLMERFSSAFLAWALEDMPAAVAAAQMSVRCR